MHAHIYHHFLMFIFHLSICTIIPFQLSWPVSLCPSLRSLSLFLSHQTPKEDSGKGESTEEEGGGLLQQVAIQMKMKKRNRSMSLPGVSSLSRKTDVDKRVGLRSLLKSPKEPVDKENRDRGRNVSFFDDVTVYLFDQVCQGCLYRKATSTFSCKFSRC